MVAFSKDLMEFIKTTADCRDVNHSNACTVHCAYQLYRFFLSNAKYYAPIIALPAIAKFRTKLSGDVLKDTLRYYLECVVAGTGVGWGVLVSKCLLRYLLGEFKYYTFLFVPSIIGGLTINFSSVRVQRLHALSILQCTIETFLLRRQNIFTRTIANSKFLQTLMFMLSSAIILHAKQTGIYKGFWLLVPNRASKPNNSDELQTNSEAISEQNLKKSCTHDGESCFQHLFRGVRSYFAFGITLDFLKALIKSAPKDTIGFWNKLFAKLRNVQPNSAALLTSYMGIYRFTYCYLNRTRSSHAATNHLVASFLSGLCYIFMPKLSWLSYAIVLSIQISWQYLKTQESVKTNENEFWKTVTELPFSKILYPICLAFLIHSYCFRSEISNLGQIIINNTTDFHAQKILLKLNDLDKFLTSTQ